MPTIVMSKVPRPDSWEEFEEMVRDLYARIWGDPNARRHGRTGQAQAGVDVYGQPVGSRGRYAGIQCKKYGEGRLNRRIIRSEIAKAEKFQPRLAVYYIATTELRDADLQRVVREINAERRSKKKFAVHLLFWEDLWSQLASPEHKDLIRKYYSEMIDIFGTRLADSPEFIQVASERLALQKELGTLEEHHIQQEWEELRAESNAGYREGIRAKVSMLVDETEQAARKAPVSNELKGKVYRLAANVFIPQRSRQDAAQCRIYLAKARDYSSGAQLLQCQMIETLLAYLEHGLDAALAVLNGAHGSEVDRMRFSLCLDGNRLSACTEILQEISNEELLKKDWQRLLASYYAALGNRQSMDNAVQFLLQGAAHADEYIMSAMALARFAEHRLARFCEIHQVCPSFHLGLDLGELFDTDLGRRASEAFLRASEMYLDKGCTTDAILALVSATRLEMDSPASQNRESLLNRLEKMSPDHPLAVVTKKDFANRKASEILQQFETWLQDPSTDPLLVLGVAHRQIRDEAVLKQLVRLLEEYKARFVSNDILFAQYLLTGFELAMLSGSIRTAQGWVARNKPPKTFAHLELLLPFLIYERRKPQLASVWLEKMVERYPDHPEILFAAIHFLRKQEDHVRELEYARKLFDVLRTSQTAPILLNALISAERLDEFVQQAALVNDLPLDQEKLQRGRAEALLHLDRPLEALGYLEWLREHSLADAVELLNLARVYQYLSQHAQALTTLQDCVDRFPDDPEGYIEYSQVCLDAGNRERGYEWALRARVRFPDDPNVAMHFFFTSHLTGYEMRPEVGKAFREFVPGGRFASTGRFRAVRLDELKDMIQSENKNADQLREIYQKGQAPAIILCYVQNIPFWQFHFLSARFGQPRYAAAGDQGYSATWLNEHKPQEVVLDYSAILTLWSLYAEQWLDILRQHFKRVWIPETLLPLMHWELRQLVQRGQPARHQARTAIQDKVTRKPSKFNIHPTDQPSDQVNPDITKIEQDIAVENHALYVNQYAPDEQSFVGGRLGVRAIAEILDSNGEISLDVKQRLVEHVPAHSFDREAIIAGAPKGTAVAVDMVTFVEIAFAGALDAFCDHFDLIHLSEPAWRRTQDEIAQYELQQQMTSELRRVQDILGQGIQSTFVQLGTMSSNARVLKLDKARASMTGEEEPRSRGEIQAMLVKYLDDLIGIAHTRNAPLWTDDRWTNKLSLKDYRPPYSFGTDIFLEWRRDTVSTSDEAFVNYGHLIEFGYWGLPVNPNYVSWLLSRDLKPAAKSFQAVLSVYRNHMLDFWRGVKTYPELSSEFGVRLLSSYNEGTIDILWRCYRSKLPADTCGSLFKELDLSRRAPQVLGREPSYYASLQTHLMWDALPGIDANTADSRSQRVSFCRWVDNVLQEASVAPELIQEAWYELMEHPIAMYHSATEEKDKVVAAYLAKLLFDTAPDHARDYLLNSNLSPQMREAFGLGIKYIQQFSYTGAETAIRITVPVKQWSEDLHAATAKFIAEEPAEPITIGTATIRAKWYAPGSVFMQQEVVPSEIYNHHPDWPGKTGYICILTAAVAPTAGERLGFWRQGLRMLESSGLATETWTALKDVIASDETDAAIEAGQRLQQLLLGSLPIAKQYLEQAASLGVPAVKRLLVHIQPSTVRSWVEMPSMDWTTEDGLRAWARTRASVLTGQLGPDSTAADQLARSLDLFGYSIFPDSEVWQESIVNRLQEAGDEKKRDVEEAAFALVEHSESRSRKANVLRLLLQLGLPQDDPGSNRIERIRVLLNGIVRPIDHVEREDNPHFTLEQDLGYYLYAAWRSDPSWAVDASRELAYLAHVGAGFIIDALASGGLASQGSVQRFCTDLHIDAVQQRLSTEQGDAQPVGLYKPRWELYLNYALAYSLGNIGGHQLDLNKAVIDEGMRHTLLTAGTRHRLIQSYMQNLGIQRDWLDSRLMVDIAQGLAAVLFRAYGEDFEGWSDIERFQLKMCAVAKVGMDVIEGRFQKLSEADENEVDNLVGISFLAAPSWSQDALQIVERLVDPGSLTQIQRFPLAYRELIWNLFDLLLANPAMDTEFGNHVRGIVFGIPSAANNVGDLIEQQAETLARLAGFRLQVNEIAKWLQTLSSTNELPVADVRRGFLPFVQMWTHYDGQVRDIVGSILEQIADNPRFARLWELRRIRREKSKEQETAVGNGETNEA